MPVKLPIQPVGRDTTRYGFNRVAALSTALRPVSLSGNPGRRQIQLPWTCPTTGGRPWIKIPDSGTPPHLGHRRGGPTLAAPNGPPPARSPWRFRLRWRSSPGRKREVCGGGPDLGIARQGGRVGERATPTVRLVQQTIIGQKTDSKKPRPEDVALLWPLREWLSACTQRMQAPAASRSAAWFSTSA